MAGCTGRAVEQEACTPIYACTYSIGRVAYSSLVGGHMGVKQTLEKFCCRFYWVGQRKDISQWCISYSPCCSIKASIPAPCAPMQLDPVEKPLQRVAMDILGPLPEPGQKKETSILL